MPDIYEIGSLIVAGGENPKIHFGETTMVFGGSAHRLPYFVTGKAYETNLNSVMKFENYGKRFLGFGEYFRDEVGVNVKVGDKTVFRKDGENVVIEWTGEKYPCETENKSVLKPEEYEKLKELATELCAK